MSLPFLKVKHQTGLMTSVRTPDEKPAGQEAPDDSALESCAEDLMNAIQSGDKKAAAAALRAAFTVLESEDHEEPGEIEPDESEES